MEEMLRAPPTCPAQCRGDKSTLLSPAPPHAACAYDLRVPASDAAKGQRQLDPVGAGGRGGGGGAKPSHKEAAERWNFLIPSLFSNFGERQIISRCVRLSDRSACNAHFLAHTHTTFFLLLGAPRLRLMVHWERYKHGPLKWMNDSELPLRDGATNNKETGSEGRTAALCECTKSH